jgi:hypothetical protein
MASLPQRFFALILCAVVCGATGTVAVVRQRSSGDIQTEDHNGDGRPDIWRVYDGLHRLSEVMVDTNFDGRSDVHEYYEGGALVRRESDRDFNDRVDLVEEFDPATSEHVRSVVDVDRDGTADLLVLFRGGRPVFTKFISRVTPAADPYGSVEQSRTSPRRGRDQLTPLADPFRADLVFRTVRAEANNAGDIGLATSGGLPAPTPVAVSPLAPTSPAPPDASSHLIPAPILQYSPRGPPTSASLS